MEYFAGNARKSYYAMLIAAFYISLQAFIMLSVESPFPSDMHSASDLYVVHAVKNVNDGTLVSSRSGAAQRFSQLKTAFLPRPLAVAFSKSMRISAERPREWEQWNLSVGCEQQSHPSSEMVFRK
ncbi:MAG: hypothetical protein RR501_02505 [Cloacibacillus sp.]